MKQDEDRHGDDYHHPARQVRRSHRLLSYLRLDGLVAVSWLATPPSTFFCELPCLSVRLSINQSLCVQENLIMPSPKKE